jgi:hypothetical protein
MPLTAFLGEIIGFDEENFLRAVYWINGRSFSNLKQYERMPLSKIALMVKIHIAAVEAEAKAWEKK